VSGAPEDSAGDARLDALLEAMRAYHAGKTSSRAPVVPGESSRDAERRLGQESRTWSTQHEDATAAVSATHGRVTAVAGGQVLGHRSLRRRRRAGDVRTHG
jgi:hypothetical protein